MCGGAKDFSQASSAWVLPLVWKMTSTRAWRGVVARAQEPKGSKRQRMQIPSRFHVVSCLLLWPSDHGIVPKESGQTSQGQAQVFVKGTIRILLAWL